MKAPLIILIAIMVCIIGFLVIYSQQHETIATAAPGHGVAGGYGSAPAGFRRLRFVRLPHRLQAATAPHRRPHQADTAHLRGCIGRLRRTSSRGRIRQIDVWPIAGQGGFFDR